MIWKITYMLQFCILLEVWGKYVWFTSKIPYLVHGIEDGFHEDIIKWGHFPRYWPFVRGIHWSPVDFPHKCQRRGALIFSLICAWTNGFANNRDAGDLRRHCTYYDVTLKRIHLIPYQCLDTSICYNTLGYSGLPRLEYNVYLPIWYFNTFPI